jgi:hypothetical protein
MQNERTYPDIAAILAQKVRGLTHGTYGGMYAARDRIMNVHQPVRKGKRRRREVPRTVLTVNHISIRDLQKISGETIRDLRGPTPIKSGDRTVGILVPLKAADPDRLAAVLARAEALARGHDAKRDDEALRQFGDVDPIDWSVEEVRKLMAETRKR